MKLAKQKTGGNMFTANLPHTLLKKATRTSGFGIVTGIEYKENEKRTITLVHTQRPNSACLTLWLDDHGVVNLSVSDIVAFDDCSPSEVIYLMPECKKFNTALFDTNLQFYGDTFGDQTLKFINKEIRFLREKIISQKTKQNELSDKLYQLENLGFSSKLLDDTFEDIQQITKKISINQSYMKYLNSLEEYAIEKLSLDNFWINYAQCLKQVERLKVSRDITDHVIAQKKRLKKSATHFSPHKKQTTTEDENQGQS